MTKIKGPQPFVLEVSPEFAQARAEMEALISHARAAQRQAQIELRNYIEGAMADRRWEPREDRRLHALEAAVDARRELAEKLYNDYAKTVMMFLPAPLYVIDGGKV